MAHAQAWALRASHIDPGPAKRPDYTSKAWEMRDGPLPTEPHSLGLAHKLLVGQGRWLERLTPGRGCGGCVAAVGDPADSLAPMFCFTKAVPGYSDGKVSQQEK